MNQKEYDELLAQRAKIWQEHFKISEQVEAYEQNEKQKKAEEQLPALNEKVKQFFSKCSGFKPVSKEITVKFKVTCRPELYDLDECEENLRNDNGSDFPIELGISCSNIICPGLSNKQSGYIKQAVAEYIGDACNDFTEELFPELNSDIETLKVEYCDLENEISDFLSKAERPVLHKPAAKTKTKARKK